MAESDTGTSGNKVEERAVVVDAEVVEGGESEEERGGEGWGLVGEGCGRDVRERWGKWNRFNRALVLKNVSKVAKWDDAKGVREVEAEGVEANDACA